MKRLVLASLALSSLVSLVAIDRPARAEELFLDETPKDYHSVQRFALELKGGPYSPDIDKSAGLNGQTPFADLFNNQWTTPQGQKPGGKPLFTIEFDYQFLHGFGSLGLGASVGFTRRETHAFNYPTDSLGNPDQNSHCTYGVNCTRSGDTTSLTIFPVELLLVYRFDVLALKYGWKFPLVPYLKGGVGYYFWFIQRGDGSLAKKLPDDTSDSGTKAIGGTPGLVAHPGVSIMLDAIDARAATALDSEIGINHVHLFAELNYAWMTGLGFKNKLDLSDLSWTVGMGFEF